MEYIKNERMKAGKKRQSEENKKSKSVIRILWVVVMTNFSGQKHQLLYFIEYQEYFSKKCFVKCLMSSLFKV